VLIHCLVPVPIGKVRPRSSIFSKVQGFALLICVECMAAQDGDVRPDRQGQDVATIYRGLGGHDGAEVVAMSGGGASIRFLSIDAEIDTNDFAEADGKYGNVRSLVCECLSLAGVQDVSVRVLISKEGLRRNTIDAFVPIIPSVMVMSEVSRVKTEILGSCAPHWLKLRGIQTVELYAASSELIPAFRVSHIIEPRGTNVQSRIMISNVTKSSAEFVMHLVGHAEFGVTRVVFRAKQRHLEIWYVVPPSDDDDSHHVLECDRANAKRRRIGWTDWFNFNKK
jgi:hypothetical protein